MDNFNVCISAKEVIECISKDKENDKCFDCGADKPLWASVNNGVVICLNCSIMHKDTLGGAYFSKVRSINKDMWSEKHIKLMEEGGNSKLREFLVSSAASKVLKVP